MNIEDFNAINSPSQDYRLYVGVGNEIKIAVDGQLVTPPPTTYPATLNQVPFRPTVVMGPHRIGFVGEAVRFYGGYSYQRWRVVASNHQWVATGNPLVTITVDASGQVYQREPPEAACAAFTWTTPGIYEVSLTVYELNSTTRFHTGTRQVIVYASRDQAYSGVTEVSGITGSISGGGWSVAMKLKGNLAWLLAARDIKGYIPIVIMAELFHETNLGVFEPRTIGRAWSPNNYRDDPRIIFSGYLDSSSIETSLDGSSTSIQARTSDMILEQMQTHTWGFFEHPRNGSGKIFNDLQIEDVLRHMLQEHSNFTDWNDTRFYYNIAQIGGDRTIPNMEYNDWTFQQGMYWSNIRDSADNEFKRAYVDATSALCIVPDRNMWPASSYVDLRNRSVVPLPVGETAIGRLADRDTNGALVIQRMAIRERITAAVSYYKIIANLSFWNEEWGADYPKDKPGLFSGKWVLVQGKYFSDQSRDNAWANLWRFAARGYAAANARYTLEVTLGIVAYLRLGDILEVLYEDPQGRANFVSSIPATNLFEIESLSYQINTEQQTWLTVVSLRELTIYAAPVAVIPPIPSLPEGI